MELDPNKSYYIVDIHTDKGFTYEVYASYDYVRESFDSKGDSVSFEPAGDYTYKIRMNGGHWSDHHYLTLSGKGWVYLDKKENATRWDLSEGVFGGETLKIIAVGLNRQDKYLAYTQKGNKKWLGGHNYEGRKGFKILSAD